MNRLAFGSIVLLFAALGTFVALAWLGPGSGGAAAPPTVVIEGATKHLVTGPMAEASRSMIERMAPPFEALTIDGKVYKLDELRRRGPVVLTFIKDGCPCSESAQPYFNRLVVAHPGAEFLGVIDVDAEKAARWASKCRVSYPLLLDPALEIVRAFHVENSAYVVLIDSGGRIRKHWPGYSSGMLRELGATLAELTGSGERPIDIADAPEDEYTGCPFDP